MVMHCHCKCCGQQIITIKESELEKTRQEFLRHWKTDYHCQWLWYHPDSNWRHLSWTQALIYAIQKYPMPSQFRRYIYLHRKLFATMLVANCLAVWQLFVDEATARNFILNAFEDVRAVEKKVRNFDSMMHRLLHQGYFTVPPGYPVQTSLINFITWHEWMHNPTGASPSIGIQERICMQPEEYEKKRRLEVATNNCCL